MMGLCEPIVIIANCYYFGSGIICHDHVAICGLGIDCSLVFNKRNLRFVLRIDFGIFAGHAIAKELQCKATILKCHKKPTVITDNLKI